MGGRKEQGLTRSDHIPAIMLKMALAKWVRKRGAGSVSWNGI